MSKSPSLKNRALEEMQQYCEETEPPLVQVVTSRAGEEAGNSTEFESNRVSRVRAQWLNVLANESVRCAKYPAPQSATSPSSRSVGAGGQRTTSSPRNRGALGRKEDAIGAAERFAARIPLDRDRRRNQRCISPRGRASPERTRSPNLGPALGLPGAPRLSEASSACTTS